MRNNIYYFIFAFGETTLDTLGVTRQGIYKLRIDNGKLTMKRQENFAIYTNYNCHLSIANCHFRLYDYLGSLRFTMKADGTLLNFKQYAAFGETTLDTLGVTRQGIQKLKIDNEKLTMVLGNHISTSLSADITLEQGGLNLIK